MSLSGFKFYIAMIALLAFISQSFAVVNISCAGMDMDRQATSAVMTDEMIMGSMMAHASHAQPGDSDLNVGAECCNQKQCSQGNCTFSSVAAVSADLSLPLLYSKTFNSDYSVFFLTQQVPSLFRPPISR